MTDRTMALAKPPSTPTLPVPKLKRMSAECRRVKWYATAAIMNAMACVLMCQPSASNAIECDMTPAVISRSIIATVMTITARVRRSACEKSCVKSWECRN